MALSLRLRRRAHDLGGKPEARSHQIVRLLSCCCVQDHRDGHIEENRSIPLQHESTGNKNWHQAIGSTLSYGMRYCGIMLLGVSSKESDDGKGAGEQSIFISDEQVKELEDLISSTGANKQRFLAHIKEETLDQMPIVKFDRAKQALLAKQKEAAQ